MEFALKTARAAHRVRPGSDAISESVRDRLTAYLRHLGIASPELLDSLTTHCLNQARQRVGKDLSEEWLRRSIEEAQKRMDSGIAKLLGLNVTRDAHAIAGARAALLMCPKHQATDFVFVQDEPDPVRVERLRSTLPVPTPPETPRAMPPQKLDFLLFRSS